MKVKVGHETLEHKIARSDSKAWNIFNQIRISKPGNKL